MPRRLVQDFGPSKDAKKGKSEEQMRKKAEELAASGMPFQMAMAVAHGKLTLSEALERMARQDKVATLMKRHDLSRALATQVAMGHADLERVLARQRFEAHRVEYRNHSILDAFAESGEPLTVDMHGRRRLTGTVSNMTAYSFNLTVDGGEPEEIHKLQAMAAWSPDSWKRVRKVLKTDKKRSADPKDPVPKPQDRYACSDKRLFRCLDEETPVTVTSLEGMQLSGLVRWVSRFELGLTLKGDSEAVVFRHALDHLREG